MAVETLIAEPAAPSRGARRPLGCCSTNSCWLSWTLFRLAAPHPLGIPSHGADLYSFEPSLLKPSLFRALMSRSSARPESRRGEHPQLSPPGKQSPSAAQPCLLLEGISVRISRKYAFVAAAGVLLSVSAVSGAQAQDTGTAPRYQPEMVQALAASLGVSEKAAVERLDQQATQQARLASLAKSGISADGAFF